MIKLLVNGKPLQTFTHNGVNFCVAPDEECDFEIEVTCAQGAYLRHEVVLSVDGLDVLDGKAASKEKRGYVVAAPTLRVPGWRIDDKLTARFRFGRVGMSYAEQVNRGGNVGVIGAAVYAERNSYSRGDIAYRGGSASLESRGPTHGMSMTLRATAPDVGTGFGDRHDFATSTTSFVRAMTPPTVYTLYYRTLTWFTQNGIVVPLAACNLGDAFPGDSATGCQLPPGYQ